MTTDLTFKILIALFALVSMIIMKNYNKFSTPNLYAKSQFEVPHAIVPRYSMGEDGSRSVQTSFLGDSKEVIEEHAENATYCENATYINWRSPTYGGTYSTVHYSTDAGGVRGVGGVHDANWVRYRRDVSGRDGEINPERFVGEDVFAGVDV